MPEAFAFNARAVEPAQPRDNTLVPNNWYRAWIIESDIAPNSKGTGKNMTFTWEIVEGDYAKRRVWDSLSIENPSAEAVKFAEKTLSAICHATGVLDMQNTGQLHGEVCMIKVGVEKGKGDFPDKNKIYGYLPDGDPKATVVKPKVGAGATGAVRGAAPRTMESAPIGDEDDSLPF